MRIVDTHTHLPGHTFGGTPRATAELRAEFCGAGLSAAWLMTTDGLLGDAERNNDILARAVERDLDFFVPFATVNPHAGAAAAVAELVRCKEHLGMRGLKLHPWLQAFSMTHPAVRPILEAAGGLNMPVLFHDGTPPYCSPLQVAAAAEQVPGTTIILGHAGLDQLWQDALLACRRHANVYLCLCSLSSGLIRRIAEQAPADRLLFGSDGGFGAGLVEWALAKVRGAGLEDGVCQTLFERNPRRLIPG